MAARTMKKFTQPYLHYQISEFLPRDIYEELLDVYQHLQFKDKETDLFHFFQTDELAQHPKIQPFKRQLDKQFKQLEPLASGAVKQKDTFYNIFASYYFEGNYLLCHDDVVQDRKYAFSYYLEDFPSGELVLFNKDATREVKRINVKRNTLVIFEVSNISYHEVSICNSDGRKAVTGWFNIKGQGSQREEKTIAPFSPSLPTKGDVLRFPLSSSYADEEYFHLMDVQYQFNVVKEQLQGPFYSRMITKIEISPCVIFEIPGYQIYSADFYRVGKGHYILLNDPVNTIHGEVLDIFVTCLPDRFEQEEDSMLIKIVEEDGELSGIPEIHDSVFMVNRGQKQYYIDRNQKQFMFGHFIYLKKQEEDSKFKKTFIKATSSVSGIPNLLQKSKQERKPASRPSRKDANTKTKQITKQASSQAKQASSQAKQASSQAKQASSQAKQAKQVAKQTKQAKKLKKTNQKQISKKTRVIVKGSTQQSSAPNKKTK